jgi:hypothetical protein
LLWYGLIVPCSYGYDKYGYGKEGYDKYGYDHKGYDKYGYNKEGYGKDGYHKEGYSRWAMVAADPGALMHASHGFYRAG